MNISGLLRRAGEDVNAALNTPILLPRPMLLCGDGVYVRARLQNFWNTYLAAAGITLGELE